MVERMTHNIVNPNVVKNAFINNNTFSGYLHSRDAVQLFPLDLQDDTHLSQLGPNFPHVRFFAVLKTFLKTRSPTVNGLSFTLASSPYLSLC